MIMILLLSLVLFCNTSTSEPLTLRERYNAACKVTKSGAAGSGLVIAKTGNTWWIKTNSHVTGRLRKGNQVGVEFFIDGVSSGLLKAKFYKGELRNRTSVDFAILTLDDSEFKDDRRPTVIPVAPREFLLQERYEITSTGCPSAWQNLEFIGYILKLNNSTFEFLPSARSGQSGSGIVADIPLVFNKDTKQWEYAPDDPNAELYTRDVGTLTWRRTDSSGKSIGAAPSHRTFLDWVDGRVSYEPIPENYEPVGVDYLAIPNSYVPVQYEEVPTAEETECPDGGCPIDEPILPWRNREDRQENPNLEQMPDFTDSDPPSDDPIIPDDDDNNISDPDDDSGNVSMGPYFAAVIAAFTSFLVSLLMNLIMNRKPKEKEEDKPSEEPKTTDKPARVTFRI